MSNASGKSTAAKPAFVVWKEWYSVGHDELDHHHKTILSILNELYVDIQKGPDSIPVNSTLDRMEDYANWHFAREEELMLSHQFPGTADHKADHRRFVQDLSRMRFQNLKPGAMTDHELLQFLKRWWLEHICGTDKQYSPYVSRTGSEEPQQAGDRV